MNIISVAIISRDCVSIIESLDNINNIFDLQCFNNYFDILDYLDNEGYFDVYVIDVELPGIDGFDLANIIKEKYIKSHFIFLTKDKSYALRAYEYYPIDFILKPVSEKRLISSIKKANEVINRENRNEIVIKSINGLRKISIDDIVFIEGCNHYQNVYINDEVIVVRNTLSSIEVTLKKYNIFVRAHQSYLINIKKIKCIEHKVAMMENGYKVEISKRLYPQLKKQYREYFKINA